MDTSNLLYNLQGEDKQFVRRLEDLFSQNIHVPKFTPFLTERQSLIAKSFVYNRKLDEYTSFFGGFSEAARQVLGFFPPYQPPDTALFPIQAVVVRYRKQDQLTHRDFLGACLGLLITRESIGDVIPQQGKCTIFVLDSVAQVLIHELHKVGRIGVQCEYSDTVEIDIKQEFEQIHSTISSPRLDNIVCAATNLSREKSAKLIQSEQVQVNYLAITSISREISVGDILSIRGHGKFIVDEIGNPTRKGRLPVDLRKYR